MNRKRWRIDTCTAIIYHDSVWILWSEDTKTINKLVAKKIGSGYHETSCVKVDICSGVRLKIRPLNDIEKITGDQWEQLIGMTVLAQFPDIPGDSWYRVRNLYTQHLGMILQQCRIDNTTGEFKDIFHTAVSSSSDTSGLCSLVSENMVEYEEYLDEAMRKINCEMGKKTKKWTLGRRYDTVFETVYPLCQVEDYRDDSFDPVEGKAIWIVTQDISGIHTISEALSKKAFGDNPWDLHVVKSVPGGYVESGVALINDYSGSFDDYLPAIIEEGEKRYKKEIGNLSSTTTFYLILPLLYCTENLDWYKSYLELLLREAAEKCLVNFYDDRTNASIVYTGMLLGENNTEEQNIDVLSLLILKAIDKENLGRLESILKFFDINLHEICADLLHTWNPNNFLRDFDTYVKNLDYFNQRTKMEKIDLRANANKAHEVLGTGSLYETVLRLSQEPEYSYVRVDSRSISHLEAKITVHDVLRDAQNRFPEVLEDLKHEILKNKFTWVEIIS